MTQNNDMRRNNNRLCEGETKPMNSIDKELAIVSVIMVSVALVIALPFMYLTYHQAQEAKFRSAILNDKCEMLIANQTDDE